MVLKYEQYTVQLCGAELIGPAERQNMLPPSWGYNSVAMPPLRAELIFWLGLSQRNVDPWHQLKVTACSIAWCRHTTKTASVKKSWFYISQLVNVSFKFFLPSELENNIP